MLTKVVDLKKMMVQVDYTHDPQNQAPIMFDCIRVLQDGDPVGPDLLSALDEGLLLIINDCILKEHPPCLH